MQLHFIEKNYTHTHTHMHTHKYYTDISLGPHDQKPKEKKKDNRKTLMPYSDNEIKATLG